MLSNSKFFTPSFLWERFSKTPKNKNNFPEPGIAEFQRNEGWKSQNRDKSKKSPEICLENKNIVRTIWGVKCWNNKNSRASGKIYWILQKRKGAEFFMAYLFPFDKRCMVLYHGDYLLKLFNRIGKQRKQKRKCVLQILKLIKVFEEAREETEEGTHAKLVVVGSYSFLFWTKENCYFYKNDPFTWATSTRGQWPGAIARPHFFTKKSYF